MNGYNFFVVEMLLANYFTILDIENHLIHEKYMFRPIII